MVERRQAASAIIFNEQGLVLFARRATTKFPFPNTWSLPSTYIQLHEEGGQALAAAVKRKLAIDITIVDLLDYKCAPQADYDLYMRDYVARIVHGSPTPNGEDYSEVRYVNPLELFAGKDRSRMGLCTRLLLANLDRNPRLWERYEQKDI